MYDLIEIGDFNALGAYVLLRISVTLVCWAFMTAACMLDFWSGVTTARAVGEPLLSHGFRRTFVKIGEYWRVMLFALLFDVLGAFLSFYYLPFATMLCTVAVILIEGRSVIENAKRRSSHAAELPDIISKIVEAGTSEQGTEVLQQIVHFVEKTKKYGK